MSERVLIAGSGIAGLGAALALGGSGRTITLVDRDPPPPSGSAEEAFADWQRRGATQLRHSHVFLGRLTTLIRERYPDLLAELTEAGARIFNFWDGLPFPLQDRYRRAPGDEDLAILFSRRTTLELVMRRYAAKLPGVSFVDNAGVRGLKLRHESGLAIVEGLEVEREGTLETINADVVVDASGRNTPFPDWLRKEGVAVSEEESPSGILYFTRHYRLRDGQSEPGRDRTPIAGDMGYLKFAVFNADNRHFSITLATPEIETDLRVAIIRPEIFDRICTEIPGCALWTNPVRSEPASPVYAMGNLKSVWRSYLKDGKPQVLNFFAIGDAAVRTNPLYGRGCSAGVVHAHILRAALDASRDPIARAEKVEAETQASLRPYYDAMVRQDLQAIRRAEHERDPSYVPGARARLAKSFMDDAIGPATRGDLDVLRGFSRAFHMIDHPMEWLKRPSTMARILSFWAMPKALKQARGLYPPKAGPERREMLAKLDLAA
ncbi:MAG: FAD-dependent oxidoreductase [Alphaproteobacteria bacterium]|nr:FAD-dependent oxidoreductase [Alphaproteobacteria bacterium]